MDLNICAGASGSRKGRLMGTYKVKTSEDFYRNRVIENLKEIHNVTRLRQLVVISEKMRKRELSDAEPGEKGEKCSGN